MRLAGQQRGGFYPIPPSALLRAMEHVSFIGSPTVLDPCAGEGAALALLRDRFNARPYAIELDEGRSETLKGVIPDAVCPASAFGTKVYGYVDMLYLNPPYDNELGGGSRVEQQFLMHCSASLKRGGLLMLVVPERILGPYSDTTTYLRERFDDVRVMRFPETVRRFNEVVVFGVKRDTVKSIDYNERWRFQGFEDVEPDAVYNVAATAVPRGIEKQEFTQNELAVAFANSPLQRLLESPKPAPLPRPPLPVTKGHLAMLLASGHMDGLVSPPGEMPHVIRGTATKKQYLKEESIEEKDDCTTQKQVYAEKVLLTIRALTHDARIVDLTQE